MYIKKVTPRRRFKLKIKTTQLLYSFPIIPSGQTVSWRMKYGDRFYTTRLYPNIICPNVSFRQVIRSTCCGSRWWWNPFRISSCHWTITPLTGIVDLPILRSRPLFEVRAATISTRRRLWSHCRPHRRETETRNSGGSRLWTRGDDIVDGRSTDSHWLWNIKTLAFIFIDVIA